MLNCWLSYIFNIFKKTIYLCKKPIDICTHFKSNLTIIITAMLTQILTLLKKNKTNIYLFTTLTLLIQTLFVFEKNILFYFLLYYTTFGFFLYFFVIFVSKYINFNSIINIFIVYWLVYMYITFIIIANILFKFFNNKAIDFDYVNIILKIEQKIFYDNTFLFEINNENTFFLFTISIISCFAVGHTYVYMKNDQKKEKFVLLLNAFAFAMIGLVISKNILCILLFWEFLGITSYFLIKHNDTQTQTLKSAFKAFVYNKASDLFFIIAATILVMSIESNNITDLKIDIYITNNNNFNNTYAIYVALIFIFIAACIKSVQIFSFFWLPDSMKAPAPASALIHSATLVAAGFYIILIFKKLFYVYIGCNFMLYFGMITAICGTIIACYQYDLKKILAYSTVANCGFMLSIIATNNIMLFLVYFAAHGIFKSICFMMAGEIIVLQNHEQDVRNFKYTINYNNYSLKCILILIFSLSGAPIFMVYLIKHEFIICITDNISWSVYEMFASVYGTLSIMYAILFATKTFYSSYFLKYEHYNYKANDNMSDLNLLYSFCCLITISILWYLINTNINIYIIQGLINNTTTTHIYNTYLQYFVQSVIIWFVVSTYYYIPTKCNTIEFFFFFCTLNIVWNCFL